MILFGCWGVGVYFSSAHSTHYSIIFSKTVFWVMGALAILGMIPQTNTLFGHWPLYGFEIITHGIFAIAGGYYGYYLTRDFSFHKNHHHPHGMHKV